MQEQFKTGNKTAIIHPTGTGKMYIFLKWLLDHPNETFLFLAPTSAILYQLQYTIEKQGYQISDFPNLKCALYCQLLNWNTEDFQVNYDNIVLDEFHRAGAPKWGKAVNTLLEFHPNSKVLGLSATPTRYVDHKNMVDILFEGNIASEITLAEAMAKGILPLPTYINTIYSLEEQIQELEDKVKKVKNKTRRQQLEQLLEKAKSYLLQVEGLDKIFSKYIAKKDGKYLIFCKDIKHLNEIKAKIGEWFKGINPEIEIYDIHSKHQIEENEKTLRNFRKDTGTKLKILLSVEMLNEGLHVEDIDGVIMLRPTNSHIIYLQQMGRGLSVNSKKPLIIDIVNNIEAYQNIYNIREEIEEIIRRNPEECISQAELDAQFKIIDYVQNIMSILQIIDRSFRMSNQEKITIIQNYLKANGSHNEITRDTIDEKGYPIGEWIAKWKYGRIPLMSDEKKLLETMGIHFEKTNNIFVNNQEKIAIIQAYIKEGHQYLDIIRSTIDKEGHPIGHWMSWWRTGHVQLTEEERNILISMGETFERKISESLTNSEKIGIIQKYLQEGKNYKDIKKTTKDQDGHSLGEWISWWRSGSVKLTEEERQTLIEMGETFEKKNSRPLTSQEKIAIIQEYLKEGHAYSDIKHITIDEKGHPIGKWINWWRSGRVQLTEQERDILISMGEPFPKGVSKLRIIDSTLQTSQSDLNSKHR